MTEAVKAVEAGMSLRQVHNVPVETTRQRVLGKVVVDCKPGPVTAFM